MARRLPFADALSSSGHHPDLATLIRIPKGAEIGVAP